MEVLDITDKKIIAELDLNARQHNSQIAKSLKLSKEVVSYRIRRMEADGYIKGYYAVMNPSLLGITYYRVLIKYHSLDPKTEKQLVEFLKKHRYVGWIATCFGKYDMVLVIEVENAYQLDQFLYEFFSTYGQHIVEKEITVFSSSSSFNKKFLMPNYEVQALDYIHQPRRLSVDKTDLSIIKELSTNARKSLVEIAKAIKFTPRAVYERIKKLEKSGILQGYRVSVDFAKLGYLYTHTLIKLENIEARSKLMGFFKQHESTLYGAFQIGAYDVSIESVVKNFEELDGFINETRAQFVKDIKNYDALVIKNEYKLTYYPFEAFTI